MNLHSDFSQRVVLPVHEAGWLPCVTPEGERCQLDGVSDGSSSATYIVRYAPGTRISTLAHYGGEEIFVLGGAFSDELGTYRVGTYLRHPPGSTNTVTSPDGCTLFVKEWQFSAGDLSRVQIDTATADWYPGLVPGLSVMPLHEYDGVSTALVRWAPDTRFNMHAHPGGEEILVLEGVFSDEHGTYPAGTWIRSPRWSRHTPFTGAEGSLIYVKVGAIGAEFIAAPTE